MLQPTTNIQSALVSAKRGRRERNGIHAWHPYYAGYAESFVESAISYLDLKPCLDVVLLDPWNGSGTTTLVANRMGFTSIGCELNPVINVFASTKYTFLAKRHSEVEELLVEILLKAKTLKYKVKDKDPLLEFMSPEFISIVRRMFEAIEKIHYPKVHYNSLIKSLSVNVPTLINPFKALFCTALFTVSRKIAGYKPGSNPTWIKSSTEKVRVSWVDFCKLYSAQVASILVDILDAKLGNTNILSSLVCETDSRKLPIPDSSIDGIITSPPYLTRIDYAISVKPELLIMFNPERLREIRENTIGAPVIVEKGIEISKKWGAHCQEILSKVMHHKTKAAKSYYLPNMLQYFRDIELSLFEIKRVLKPGAKALIVVQSSYFKEIEIHLGEIYVEIIKCIGGRSKIVGREVVRGHMAHVNTRSNGYHNAKIFYEDVVLLEKVTDGS